jgi:topoisomerase-4 subunit A
VATVDVLFDKNFLEYASYVIRDRAIPELEDGLKPVQRRILHSLFEMDDGKFHKVANVIGHCMCYHPHGDSSIGQSLVVLANKDLFIDKQGNFGNIFTGDEASAPRYIECRVNAFAKTIFYKPHLTVMIDSYDGRNKEPMVFPAKIPTVLLMGAEGIAVGMSTKILPHNIIETLEAEKNCLEGKSFKLFPDFPTGGLVDASDYRDGNGRILVRAKLDTSDSKKIIIRELPFGSTTESLINSIEAASKAGKIKIQSISDFTAEHVEIEIKLARGIYAQETIDSLFAWTDCEQSISVNLLVIKDHLPTVLTISEIIHYHAVQLVRLLTQELEYEKKSLLDKIRTLNIEKIFIENRLYTMVESAKTPAAIIKAIQNAFVSFPHILPITGEEIEKLLKIPIRRLSLFDSVQAHKTMNAINKRIKELNSYLNNSTEYAITFLNNLIEQIKKEGWGNRKTIIGQFNKIAIKEVVKRDINLKYDRETGYLGTIGDSTVVATVSQCDKIFIVRNNASYIVIDVPEKVFIGPHAWYIGVAEKEIITKIVWTIFYKEKEVNNICIKRCTVESWITNHEYTFVPEDATVVHIDNRLQFNFTVYYTSKPQRKIVKETFNSDHFMVKNVKNKGVCISKKEYHRIKIE